MNHITAERHARLQAAAEREPATDQAGLDLEGMEIEAYRRLYRGLREVPLPEPPESFAADMARLVADHEERAGLEIWALRATVAVAAAGVAALAPALAPAVSAFADAAGALPWPLLLAALAAALAGGTLDRAAGRR
ncbi:hypothetical protein QFW77_00455 [Luteimonas sp. RD2P54]|uniref:DUF2868 domain-containing protein n=1 Tax=Luteimonas endophytica TaxID=3042023 RepID=A0ABT6J3R6_9GAMM|nr:hypothetical protein [Luteimonas endophytica]MDH5821466.1 hypothetical protein [Luteimonas endophytica]